MQDFLDRLADMLGVPRLATEDVDELLDLTRDVAHATERRAAPLAAFLAGRALALGAELRDVAAAARAALPPADVSREGS